MYGERVGERQKALQTAVWVKGCCQHLMGTCIAMPLGTCWCWWCCRFLISFRLQESTQSLQPCACHAQPIPGRNAPTQRIPHLSTMHVSVPLSHSQQWLPFEASLSPSTPYPATKYFPNSSSSN